MWMRPTSYVQAVAAVASLLAAGLPHRAVAALGEPEAGVAAEARQFAGSVKATQRATYRVQEITLPSGTVLREFATPGGTVFAVAWSGPALPNLRESLGRYFERYTDAAAVTPALHRHVQVMDDDLVIQSNGHMRAFAGRAYLPAALPAGVSLDDLR